MHRTVSEHLQYMGQSLVVPDKKTQKMASDSAKILKKKMFQQQIACTFLSVCQWV